MTEPSGGRTAVCAHDGSTCGHCLTLVRPDVNLAAGLRVAGCQVGR